MHAVASIFALQLGWGLWFFPWVFANLGWATASAVLALSAALFAASGVLFSTLFQATPGAVIFGDIGEHAAGSVGRTAVYAVVYAVQAAKPIVLHLAVAESLRHTFPEGSTPGVWRAGAFVFAAASLLVQVRSLSELCWLCVGGTLALLTSAAVVMSELVARRDTDAHHAVQAVTSYSLFPDGVLAVIDTAFAYGGQVGYVEVLASMRRPERFPQAVAAATLAMTALYAAFGAVGYWSQGEAVGSIVIFTLERNVRARVASALLLVCALMQYVLVINIWAHNVLILLGRFRDRHRQMAAKRAQHAQQQQRQGDGQQLAVCSMAQPAAGGRQRQQPGQQPTVAVNGGHHSGEDGDDCAAAADVEQGEGDAAGALDSCGCPLRSPRELHGPDQQPLPQAAAPTLSQALSAKLPSDHSRVAWAAATLSIALYSLLISSSVPFLSSLVGLITSATALLCAFALPGWFLLRLKGQGLGLAQRAGLWALIALALFLSVAGLAASVATFGRDD